MLVCVLGMVGWR